MELTDVGEVDESFVSFVLEDRVRFDLEESWFGELFIVVFLFLLFFVLLVLDLLGDEVVLSV